MGNVHSYCEVITASPVHSSIFTYYGTFVFLSSVDYPFLERVYQNHWQHDRQTQPTIIVIVFHQITSVSIIHVIHTTKSLY